MATNATERTLAEALRFRRELVAGQLPAGTFLNERSAARNAAGAITMLSAWIAYVMENRDAIPTDNLYVTDRKYDLRAIAAAFGTFLSPEELYGGMVRPVASDLGLPGDFIENYLTGRLPAFEGAEASVARIVKSCLDDFEIHAELFREHTDAKGRTVRQVIASTLGTSGLHDRATRLVRVALGKLEPKRPARSVALLSCGEGFATQYALRDEESDGIERVLLVDRDPSVTFIAVFDLWLAGFGRPVEAATYDELLTGRAAGTCELAIAGVNTEQTLPRVAPEDLEDTKRFVKAAAEVAEGGVALLRVRDATNVREDGIAIREAVTSLDHLTGIYLIETEHVNGPSSAMAYAVVDWAADTGTVRIGRAFSAVNDPASRTVRAMTETLSEAIDFARTLPKSSILEAPAVSWNLSTYWDDGYEPATDLDGILDAVRKSNERNAEIVRKLQGMLDELKAGN